MEAQDIFLQMRIDYMSGGSHSGTLGALTPRNDDNWFAASPSAQVSSFSNSTWKARPATCAIP